MPRGRLNHLQAGQLLATNSEGKLLLHRQHLRQPLHVVLHEHDAALLLAAPLHELRLVEVFVAVAEGDVLAGLGRLRIGFLVDFGVGGFVEEQVRGGIIFEGFQGMLFGGEGPLFLGRFFYMAGQVLQGRKIFSLTVFQEPMVLKELKKITNHLFLRTSCLLHLVTGEIFIDPNLDHLKLRQTNHLSPHTKPSKPFVQILHSPHDICNLALNLLLVIWMEAIGHMFQYEFNIEGDLVVSHLIAIDVVLIDARAVGKAIGLSRGV